MNQTDGLVVVLPGGSALVDAGDWERYGWLRWNTSQGYIKRLDYTPNPKRPRGVLWHRLVMGAVEGQQVDHINGNPRDNRKANLRVCSARQNQQNRPKPESFRGRPVASRFKGVFFDRHRAVWWARIKVDGRNVYLGSFPAEREAATAYARASKEYFGDFARTE